MCRDRDIRDRLTTTNGMEPVIGSPDTVGVLSPGVGSSSHGENSRSDDGGEMHGG